MVVLQPDAARAEVPVGAGALAAELVDPDDREAIRTRSGRSGTDPRTHPLPGDVTAAVGRALVRSGERTAYAVRSSAAAEDLPAASFAGQQDRT